MPSWSVEVAYKPEFRDAEADRIVREAHGLGFDGALTARVSHMYWIEGDLSEDDARRLAGDLFADPVSQVYALEGDAVDVGDACGWIAEAHFKPGVTDSVGESAAKGAQVIGIEGITKAATGRKLYLLGDLDEEAADRIANRILINDVIQTCELRAL
jgi:phosphoribosylformylglycinamidine (FGAM) synthase PurS component